ncbi:putative membrane protein YphA (DoxX/SURF4 family) [Brevibacterium sanguinis]|uniref:Membrane protein YphA (DoxX/SURF4 family) n=2 Tax=Brevibacterium TaxID=1696 RepID=A0ABX9GTY3_9MICO|nr:MULTISPECIES: DoxX family protein [Brevibacterium]RBP65697.1 putative membrane protein YphA (DoxX/SURF4 family) [Brevibacterium sanguinis]RBP72331.1 putative membrane protein YphA (DoxX/SURF4 family) [Brevibacterium celere]
MAIGSALLQATGRMLTAPIFISGGYSALTQPGGRVEAAGPTLDTMREYLPFLPDDDELLVRANGALQLAAGTGLLLGIKPRVSALALAASLVPTTLAGHAFWEMGEEDAAVHKTHFSKNVAALGGLLLVAGADVGKKAAQKAAKKAAKKASRQS